MLHLRNELPEGCISDLCFDQWRGGELDDARIEELEGHLERCERCQQRHDAIEAEAEAFLARFPELEVTAKDARVVGFGARRARRLAWSGTVVGLAAAAALVLVTSEKPGGGPDDELDVRSKGGSRIGFFVKHGKNVRAGGDGQVVRPGDQLRFSVTSNKPQHLAILSLDGAGVASVYYPGGSTSQVVGVVRDHPVDSSVLLDDTLGEERIWGIFCDEPFALEPLRASLERSRALPPLAGCTVDEYAIVKEAAP